MYFEGTHGGSEGEKKGHHIHGGVRFFEARYTGWFNGSPIPILRHTHILRVDMFADKPGWRKVSEKSSARLLYGGLCIIMRCWWHLSFSTNTSRLSRGVPLFWGVYYLSCLSFSSYYIMSFFFLLSLFFFLRIALCSVILLLFPKASRRVLPCGALGLNHRVITQSELHRAKLHRASA